MVTFQNAYMYICIYNKSMFVFRYCKVHTLNKAELNDKKRLKKLISLLLRISAYVYVFSMRLKHMYSLNMYICIMFIPKGLC